LCIFCEIPPDRIILQNKHWIAVFDNYPVSEMHALIILKKHVESFFMINDKEIISFNEILKELRFNLQMDDLTIAGFNVGINDGEYAGQTIMHVHVHLIPRRRGDVKNPRGGVRHTIPGKGFY
jgi:ATP adenylyltransferase